MSKNTIDFKVVGLYIKNMSDTKLVQSILDKITSVEQKIDSGFKNVNIRFDKTDERIDKLSLALLTHCKLGLQIARLEDDAPTIKEFNDLEKRVKRLEKHIAPV